MLVEPDGLTLVDITSVTGDPNLNDLAEVTTQFTAGAQVLYDATAITVSADGGYGWAESATAGTYPTWIIEDTGEANYAALVLKPETVEVTAISTFTITNPLTKCEDGLNPFYTSEHPNGDRDLYLTINGDALYMNGERVYSRDED